MQLLVLETGGTINGILDPFAAPPDRSRVVAWLQQHAERLGLELGSERVCMKDSRALNDADRGQLAAAVEAAAPRRILIPHGTCTMPETGTYLRAHLGDAAREKRIVLVGSLIPLHEPGSDAPAALEFAVKTLRAAPPGVWIAMQERVWHPAEVVKDSASGQFVARAQAAREYFPKE